MTAVEPLASLLGRVTATLTARSAVPLTAELYDWVLATLEHMLLSPRYCRCTICAETKSRPVGSYTVSGSVVR